MVDVSEEMLNKAKARLKTLSDAWVAGVCQGDTLDLTTGNAVIASHTACHAWVTQAYGKKCWNSDGAYYYDPWNKKYSANAEDFLVLSCHTKVRSKNVCSGEATDFLVRWMANESPFKEFILNRDDDASLTEGGVVLLCGPNGLTLSQCMWVCKVLRLITEGAQGADAFMTLVKGGVDGMLAVYISQYVRTLKGAVFGYTGLYGHMTVLSHETSVVGMMQRNLNPKATCTSNVFTAITKSIPATFDADKQPRTKIEGFCKPFKKPDGWGGFTTGVGADEAAFIAHALEWQAQLSVCLPGAKPVEEVVCQMPDSNTIFLAVDL